MESKSQDGIQHTNLLCCPSLRPAQESTTAAGCSDRQRGLLASPEGQQNQFVTRVEHSATAEGRESWRTGDGVPTPNLPRMYGLSGSTVPSLKRALRPPPPPPLPPLLPPEKPAKPDGRLNHGRPDRSLHGIGFQSAPGQKAGAGKQKVYRAERAPAMTSRNMRSEQA